MILLQFFKIQLVALQQIQNKPSSIILIKFFTIELQNKLH